MSGSVSRVVVDSSGPDEEDGASDDTTHDDYIREFSFEPEIIVPKRTASANSLTCYAGVAADGRTQRVQPEVGRNSAKRSHSTSNKPNNDNHPRAPRVRFLRPASLSLSLYKTNRPPPPGLAPSSTRAVAVTGPCELQSTESIIPPPLSIPSTSTAVSSSLKSGTTTVQSSVHRGPPSVCDHRQFSFAERPRSRQQLTSAENKNNSLKQNKFIVGDSDVQLTPEEESHPGQFREKFVSFYPSTTNPSTYTIDESAEEVDSASDSSRSSGHRRRHRSRRKASRSRSFLRGWCNDKHRPSSAEQVNNEIEAFYYVGNCDSCF